MEIFSLGATTTAEYSIPMAIVDFLPVLFYFLAAWMIAKDLYNKVNGTTYAFLAGGALMCFIGGAFKAVWKLMFCFGINYPFFFTALFPMQAPGFCLYLVGLIMALKQTKNGANGNEFVGTNLNVVAATVTTSLPMIMFQTIGSVGSLVCLAIFAKRMKQGSGVVCFVLSIVFLLAMGGLGATLDSSLSWANWVEQGVNLVAQLLFYAGAVILHKNGFAEKEIGKAA